MLPKIVLHVDRAICRLPGYGGGLNWSVGFNQACFLAPEIVKFALLGKEYRPPEWVKESEIAGFMDPRAEHMSGMFLRALRRSRRLEYVVSMVDHPHLNRVPQKVFQVQFRCFVKARELVWDQLVCIEDEGAVVLVKNQAC